MMPVGCIRERELAELLHRGHWPQACSAEFRAHVAQCRSCSDLALVAESFQAMRRQAASGSPTMFSGALWWRAQLRRRNQAVERIAKPIVGAHLFAFAVVLCLAVGAVIWAIGHGVNLAAWLNEIPRSLHFSALRPDPLAQSVGSLWWVVPLLATLALISGVVVYFGSEKE